MNTEGKGFRELEHTADWELEVWAPDLPGLLEQAARGMYALTNARLEDGPRFTREVELKAYDPESLLVAFLGELLYLGEVENLAFDTIELSFTEHTFEHTLEHTLHARLEGAPLKSRAKEIKAVTYHNLAIRKTETGLRVRIVFDV